jgi:outer membrane protein assembly factor BamB
MKRPHALALSLSVALSLVAVGRTAGAASTKSFHQSTAKDFEEGEAEASMILPGGEVVSGMRASHVNVDAAFVWCSALSRDGATAYFGTGDEGKIYAVDVKGNGDRARRIADLDAAWVTALVVRPDGTLLAGTTPGGRVYTVDPKSGAAKELTTLAADHVWALAYNARTSTTYAATGSPGKIFAIDAKGRSREVWDSGDKHVVSLLEADDRHLLAGTSEEAILYRVSLDGRAEALQDFEAEEVRAVARDGEAIIIAVNDFDRTSSATTSGPPAAKGTRVTVAPSGSPASAGSLPRPGQRKSRAALYRLERDGRIEQIFSIGDGYFTSLLVGESNPAGGPADVFVASGSQGRVYRVRPDRTAALAIDLPERQALALTRVGDTFLVGTGDVGGVYRARPAAAGEATYLSKVLDADYPARWGSLRWHGTRNLTVETRSGNTARPDPSWSSFQHLADVHPTAHGVAGRLASPPARYVQYRATLGGADARLDEVSLYYLPQNQRARVTELTVGDPPPAAGAAAAATTRTHSPILKLRWKIENPDSDELTYRLAFREENEAVWRPLGGPDPLSKPEYDWNTDGLPDGTYVVRVLTSDERAQPRERALESTFISAPMLVDNRKPEVVGLTANFPFVSGRARDEGSPITAIEFSVDGGEWREVPPSDGICDDLVESFTLKLPTLAPGPHALTVRAWDSGDNVGSSSLTVRAP